MKESLTEEEKEIAEGLLMQGMDAFADAIGFFINIFGERIYSKDQLIRLINKAKEVTKESLSDIIEEE